METKAKALAEFIYSLSRRTPMMVAGGVKLLPTLEEFLALPQKEQDGKLLEWLKDTKALNDEATARTTQLSTQLAERIAELEA